MKKKLYINACRLFSLLAIVTLFVACDAHRDFPDTAMKPCHILCTDGKVLSVSDFKQSENSLLPWCSMSITTKPLKATAMRFTCGTWHRRLCR